MVYIRSRLDVADNSGARMATMIGVIGQGTSQSAGIGDVITANVKEASPNGTGEEGRSRRAVLVRTRTPSSAGRLRLRFDNNAIVIIDKDLNPRGTRIFGPVARELRERNFMKIVSLAPEVL
jgi:large subunit ribosomal protein L14